MVTFMRSRRQQTSLLTLFIVVCLLLQLAVGASPASAGLLQNIGDFLSLGANTVREIKDLIANAPTDVRNVLGAVADELQGMLDQISETFQDNLNVSLDSVDALTNNKIQQAQALIEDINSKLQDNVKLFAGVFNDSLQNAANQLKQTTAFLQDALKDSLILGGETAAFVVDRTFHNAIIVVALLILGIGLISFIWLLFKSQLPQQGIPRTLAFSFMAAFVVLFGSLVIVPQARAFVMINTGLGLKQKLDKIASDPRLIALVPDRLTVGINKELEVWGSSLLPQNTTPTAKIGSTSVNVKAASNDRIVLDIAGLTGQAEGSANVTLAYPDGKSITGVVRFLIPTATPAPVDLTIESISISPASPQEDDNVRVLVTVRNVGGGNAGSFRVGWRPCAAQPRETKVVPSLAAGQSTPVEFNHAFSTPVTCDSVVEIDIDGSVTESNEANNSATRRIVVSPKPTPAPSNKFEIRVTTGDVSFAGTDANVFITLFGTQSSSAEFKLDTPGRDDFERNQTDTFTVTTPQNLGTITRIRIRHDNSGLASGWFLARITVKNVDTNVRVTFEANRWLATDEGDGRIDIFLTR
ncbi:MAG: hypothetical protein KF716_12730 [Anaerolineae bacterium]|nr:hypothetical protein [Anaerolineae bacterium]